MPSETPTVPPSPGAPSKTVAVIDDDGAVRDSLTELLAALGFLAKGFSSAESFLQADALADTRCLLLDVMLAGMSGPELLRRLALRGLRIPAILITAHEKTALAPLTLGASACLLKPFSDAELERALREAPSR
jgi:FixJ family two-component response regulator